MSDFDFDDFESEYQYSNTAVPVCMCIEVSEKSRPFANEIFNCIKQFKEDVKNGAMNLVRFEMSIVTFNEQAKLVKEFKKLEYEENLKIKFSGEANLSSGIDVAVKAILARKEKYKELCLSWICPTLYLFTTGKWNLNPEFEPYSELKYLCINLKLTLVVIGLGDEFDSSFFRNIPRTSNRVFDIKKVNLFDEIEFLSYD